MMEAQFISDLHLTPERPALARAFMRFMDEQAPQSTSLYILGDFFDYWVGDDAMEPFHHDIASKLLEYTESGHQLFFMVGNRDFGIGRQFLKQTGATLLQDPCTIDLKGETVLLMHGDLLCIDDVQYQKYRKRIRHPLVLGLLRLTPLSYRKRLGEKIRVNSRKAKTGKSLEIMDVNLDEVKRTMEQYQVKTLIHGHTHRPKTHTVPLLSGEGQRIVLGDWDGYGWVLHSDPELKQHRFSLQPSADHCETGTDDRLS